jgi:hypothetical protein
MARKKLPGEGVTLKKHQESIMRAVKVAKKTQHKELVVFTLKRHHFVKNLSTDKGVAHQDLKPTYKQLNLWLMKKYYQQYELRPKHIMAGSIDIECVIKLKP